MDTYELIKELNQLSPCGISISNSDIDIAYDDFDTPTDKIKNIKTKEWKVTSIFNPNFSDISYTAYNENIDLALQEVINWLKENLKKEKGDTYDL